jgi:hypothetical protein
MLQIVPLFTRRLHLLAVVLLLGSLAAITAQAQGATSITTSSLPSGQVGAWYNTTLAASGGTTPYTWSLASGTLPAGLSLNASTGTLNGTPSAPVTAGALTFKVSDHSNPVQTATATLSLTIAPAALQLATGWIPDGQVGAPYSRTLSAMGGTTPYTWSVAVGVLPAGLTLNATTGVLSGTPTAIVSNNSVTFQVTDVSSPAQTSTATLTFSIAPAPLGITTSSMPNGQLGMPYSQIVSASGGTTPYTWTLANSSTLPAGLTLNASTGAVTGTPTVLGKSYPSFKVTDSANPAQTSTVTLPISIGPAGLGITTTSLPNGQAGVAYSTTLTASGGTTPYAWSLVSGTLPAGLSLNASSGAITGTPLTGVSATPLTFKVTDSSNPAQSATAAFALTITSNVSPLSITTTALPSGQVGVAYSTALAASGGTTPYTWSLRNGTLPAGLSLNAATGAITGTPTAAVSSGSLTFQATDSGSPAQNATATLTLTVSPATLTITTQSLPGGQVGTAYSATLGGSGGTTPYTWSLTAGTLPAGLSLNAATGAITGTPTTAASGVSLSFKLTDAGSPAQSATATLTLTIIPAALGITTTSLPNGQVGVAYSATLAASGGTTPYTWSITSGSLPAGLSLNAATGAITGVPTAAVSAASLSLRVADSSNPQQTSTATLSLTVAAAGLIVSTTSLPNGQMGVAYSATLAASGGTTPYIWSITSGSLPAGLSFNTSTGAITGSPTAVASNVSLTFKVTDSGNPAQTATTTLALTITPAALGITTSSLPSGQAGAAYTATLAATGGTTPYTWSLASGTLPAGLSLSTTTGTISGTPTAPVTSASLTFKVTDAGNPVQSATATLTLTISPATLSITTTALPSGQVGVAYSATLVASGGTTPYTWSLTSGTLPAGLSLNASTGAISGTPAASASNLSLTFKVSDSGSPAQTATATLTLTATPATLAITTTSLSAGQVGVAYSAALAASGGTTPYTWSLTGGTLPAGLSLNPSTGSITGTPTVAGSATLTFQVTDSGNPAQTATATVSLNIAGTGLVITTTSLPNGLVGTAYSATLTATGGATPYAWSIVGGALPAGLTLNASTGTITGTPTAAVAGASVTFKLTDASNPAQTKTATLSLSIVQQTLKISTGWIPDGQVGVAYSRTLVAADGTTPYTWSVSAGALPAGLTLNATTGVLSGTPTASVSNNTVTFRVTDSGNPVQSATASLTFSVAPAPLAITTTSMPNGQLGAPYSATVAATGGTLPYAWSLASGSTLAPGLTLNPTTGTVSGTPTALGKVYPSFKVTDSGNPVQNSAVTLPITIVAGGVAITTTSLPTGQVGAAYSATLAATGGTTPYVWSLTSGTLPAGLSLNTATGAITGTPTAAVSGASLTFTVTDSSNPALSATATLTLTVSNAPVPLSITTASLPNGQAGIAYSATLVASGGTKPYAWSITSGTLPSGLSLNSTTGTIGGTPTTAVSAAAVTFGVTDSSTPAQSATKSLTITINAPTPLSITTTSLPSGQVGAAYSTALAASGGTTPYTWSLTSGTLPAGLTLKSTTGAITGTPTASASATSLTFTVTDSTNPAQTANVTLALTIAPATLSVVTTSLPSGQVGSVYSATLAATGGTQPYTWSITNGTLPAGLSLSASAGTVTGTPTAAAAASLTFKVTDSGSPAQASTANLTLTVTSNGTVSISPRAAGLTVNQTLSVTATTNDPAGVNWTLSPSGGSVSPTTSMTGVAVTVTAPPTAGVYTLTATSVSDSTRSASIRIGVTDLAGVFTWHNDVARDGVNSHEFALTPANVNTTSFGRLFSCPVDAAIYAQPLWVANLTVGGATRNVLFVATEGDSLYAFDADTGVQLWKTNLIDSAHGGTAGETFVPGNQVGGYDLAPDVGVTGTPVIDPATGILYVVSKSIDSTLTTFYQRLHAIDIATGNEKVGAPLLIAPTYPGTGGGGTTVTFTSQWANQRAGLALVNGTVYVAWGSHEDDKPYYGWLVGFQYSGSALTQTAVFNAAPNNGAAGIWMSGSAPAADSAGNIYVMTGDGTFDVNSSTAPNNDYADSLVKLSPSLTPLSYFTPSDQATRKANDMDLGAGGPVVLTLPTGSPQHYVLASGKTTTSYLLNGDSLGGFGDATAVQTFTTMPLYAAGAFWNNTLYLGGAGFQAPIQAFTFNFSSNMFNPTAASQSSLIYTFPGTAPSISASGATNGILWALDNSQYCTHNSPGCSFSVVHAYDATNLANELWNSAQVSADAGGNAVKFTVPTVANGKIYVGTRGNNAGGADSTTSVPGQVDVYGLKR